ncbi:unnamed protein product [Gadus morhua 'NCC']
MWSKRGKIEDMACFYMVVHVPGFENGGLTAHPGSVSPTRTTFTRASDERRGQAAFSEAVRTNPLRRRQRVSRTR